MPTLTWLTRDDDLKRAAAAPYPLLEAVPELSAGDRASGNMLTGPILVYGEASRLGPDRLAAEGAAFKQTSDDVRAR